MTPADVKELRRKLGCTARELATAIGVDQETIHAWERGDLFPTKQYVEKLRQLETAGPSAIPKTPKKGRAPMELLADPALWTVVRKLLVHDAFRAKVIKLADEYDDPAIPSAGP